MTNNINQEQLLELYKTYVATTGEVSSNRLKMNAFFISVNAAVLGASGLINSLTFIVFLVLINVLWWNILTSNEKLNSAKFKVIHNMEKKLCYNCFVEESKEYTKTKRISLVKLEKGVVILLTILYLSAIAFHFVNVVNVILQLLEKTH